MLQNSRNEDRTSVCNTVLWLCMQMVFVVGMQSESAHSLYTFWALMKELWGENQWETERIPNSNKEQGKTGNIIHWTANNVHTKVQTTECTHTKSSAEHKQPAATKRCTIQSEISEVLTEARFNRDPWRSKINLRSGSPWEDLDGGNSRDLDFFFSYHVVPALGAAT